MHFSFSSPLLGFAAVAHYLKRGEFFRTRWREPAHHRMRKEAVMRGAIRIARVGDLAVDFFHGYDLSSQYRRLESTSNTASNRPPCIAWVTLSGQFILQVPRSFLRPEDAGQ